MTSVPGTRSHKLLSTIWRIALAVLPLGAGLVLAMALLPVAHDPSAPDTLALRIAAGLVISALCITAIALLVRCADHRPLADAGLTGIRTGWRLAVWGAVLWIVPAALAFAVLALLGFPMTVTVPLPEAARTVLLLLCAVLLTEAIPEEAVFRGYVTTTLGARTRGWGIILIQAVLFTVFAGLLRQNWNPADLSLFLSMGIGLGYLRMVTGSVWIPIGFHTAFQTGAQLVLTHGAVDFPGGTGAAMIALGAIPFAAAAILISSMGIPRFNVADAGSQTGRRAASG